MTAATANLTKAQKEALELIRSNGKLGVGDCGGIRRPTAYKLRDLGLIRIEIERSRWSGKKMEFAYPVSK